MRHAALTAFDQPGARDRQMWDQVFIRPPTGSHRIVWRLGLPETERLGLMHVGRGDTTTVLADALAASALAVHSTVCIPERNVFGRRK
jgi:hypothetical protein